MREHLRRFDKWPSNEPEVLKVDIDSQSGRTNMLVSPTASV